MSGAQKITVLGSTGSIGLSTLKVIRQNPESFSVFALSCYQNVSDFLQQCREFQPRYAVVVDEALAADFSSAMAAEKIQTKVLAGKDALLQISIADEVDQVMAGIVGAAGLPATLAAAQSGKRVLLANKESLVMSGRLFMDAVEQSGAELLPVDSEHNAIFQCLPTASSGAASVDVADINKILLTGSGGPFRKIPIAELDDVTPAQACAHPNWDMGQKISVDSATMMNKGLEFIEACWLFGVTAAQVQIVVHPQSIVHSMVSYKDGSVLAQMGNPDMCTPIAHAMAWPRRVNAGVSQLDFNTLGALGFEAPNEQRFPALRLAREAFNNGGVSAIVLNAANEVAVDAFLQNRIGFTDICRVIEETLNANITGENNELDAILAVDKEGREFARILITKEKFSAPLRTGKVS